MHFSNYMLLAMAAMLPATLSAAELAGDSIKEPPSLNQISSRVYIEPDNPASATTADAKHLTLSREDCLAIALSGSPTVKVADMEITRADFSKKETLAGLFPKIDFSLSYQRSIELQTVSMNMGGQTQEFKMGSDNTWNTGFNVSMPVINPTLWKSIKISDTQILQTLEQARASRIDLVNNVNKAYYSLLLAVASKDVIKANYDLAVFNADLYEKQFKAGTASEYDVLRSSVQVKNIEPELLQADIAIRQCQLQLQVLMGISDNVEIMPSVKLADLQKDMYEYLPVVARNAETLEGNTSLRELDIQRKLLKQTVDLKKMAWIPTLGASFNLNWMALSNGNALKNQPFNPYSNVALSLNVPIFSGGSKYYGLKQAQVQLKELDLQRDNLLNSLSMQVELAIDNINKEIMQIASSEEGVKQARKANDIMQKSFEIGAATYVDLRDAELANTTAQLSYLQAIYNYLVSTSELDMLLGKEDAISLGMPVK